MNQRNKNKFISSCPSIVIILFLLLSTTVFSENSQTNTSATPEELSNSMIKQSSNKEKEIRNLINEIDILVKEKRFSEAASKFKTIYDKYINLGKTTEVEKKLAALKQKENEFYKEWSIYLETQANKEFKQKKWDNSIELANKSIDILKKSKPIDEKKIKNNEKIIDSSEHKIANEQFKYETSISTLIPTNELDKQDINLYFLHAKTFIKNKQYEQARDALEKILIIDPYNFQAMYMLKNLYAKVFEAGKGRTEAELIERMSQVNWAYNQPISTKLEIANEQLIEVKVAKEQDSLIKEKLKNIIIEKIDFEDASISSVITYLNKESKRLDEDNGAGINIVLRVDKNIQDNLSRITMSMDYIPFEAVLKYICLATGLKYRVEKHAVIIGNEDIDKMQTQLFVIKSDIVNSVIANVKVKKEIRKELKKNLIGKQVERYSLTGEEKQGEADSEEKVNAGLKSEIIENLPEEISYTPPSGVLGNVISEIIDEEKTKLEELIRDEFISQDNESLATKTLKKYFINRGIPFPEGSAIAWDTRTNTLTVTNTTDNLRIMESLLSEIDINVPLVLIETKFVEIEDTDLKEFGFDWQFHLNSGNWAINEFNPDQVVSTAAEQGDGSIVQGNDSILRHYNSTFNSSDANPSGSTTQTYRNNPSTSGALINNLTFNLPTGGGSTGSLSVWLFALDRSGIAEVLSAPKVIAKSGTTATIQMIEEQYFPVNWTEPSVNIPENTLSVQIDSTTPEFEDPTDLGIKLEVTPTVNPNNYTIMLDLHPDISELAGWSDYTYQIATTGYSFDQPVRMAEIFNREVNTKVLVYDGTTTVLGGMIRESSTAVDDLVPALGEVPILGRLFRSEYKTSVKTNLLIFVTAKLVNPDGTPFRKTPRNGLFEFQN